MAKHVKGGILAVGIAFAFTAWLAIGFGHVEEGECKKLDELASKGQFRESITRWVDQYVSHRSGFDGITAETLGGVSNTRLILPFDWRNIGFSESRGKMELVGLDGRYEAVYFTEGFRAGILVTFDEKGGRSSAYLNNTMAIARFGRVSVICEAH